MRIFRRTSLRCRPLPPLGSSSTCGFRSGTSTGTVTNPTANITCGTTAYSLLARGRSYPITSYMAYALGKLKIRYMQVESAAGFDPEIMSFASPKDALVAISFSPYASATVDHARILAEQGVPVVAITDSAFSPLAQSAKVWFEVAEADCAGFRSLSATMALAMTLAVAVAERRS